MSTASKTAKRKQAVVTADEPVTEQPTDQTAQQQIPPMVVIRFRKSHSSKQIKKLTKGKGKLMSKVEKRLNKLAQENEIEAGAQPVVVVVKEKASMPFPFI